MMDEFLHKYLLMYDEKMRMFHPNLDVVDYVSYEDLNSNYVSLLMMDIDYEQLLKLLTESNNSRMLVRPRKKKYRMNFELNMIYIIFECFH
jgi:hypothetical protein